MIPQFYRFIAFNNTGQTIAYDTNGRLNLKITGFKWDDTNKVYNPTQFADNDFGFVAASSTVNGAEDKTDVEFDNTTNRYDFLHVQLEVTHDAGALANGRYDLYIDGGDATGELASDATGYDDAESNVLDLVGSLYWHSAAVDDEVMRSPVFEVR